MYPGRMARTKTRRTSDSPAKLDARIEKARSDAAKMIARETGIPVGNVSAALAGGLPAGVTRDSDRVDAGWSNIMMGLADLARDKREYHTPMAERHTYGELQELYRGNDLAARTVDRPVEDMTREGFETSIDGEEQMGDDVDGAVDELQVLDRCAEAMRKSRWAGGAAILVGAVDKVGDAMLPLDENRLERIDFLTVLDCRELYPTSYYADPLAPKFGLPRTYRVQPAFLTGGYAPGPNEPGSLNPRGSTSLGNSGDGRGKGYTPTSGYVAGSAFLQVHESRIVRFEGVNVNRWQMRETLGWGDSMLERPWKVLRNHDISWDAASYLLTDFAQAVFKMAGLKEAVAGNQAKLVQDRASIMELQRSFMRMVMIDDEDEFERKPTPLSGLPDLLDRFAKRLAAAADVPVEILYGESPAGLNATGSNTVRNYYDRIKAAQCRTLQPALRRLLGLLMRARKGPTGGKVPKTWSVTFRPLWQPTDQEIATAYQAFAAGDKNNVDAGILEPEEIAISRYGGRKFSTSIRVETKSREKFLRENPPGEHTEREAAEEGAATAEAQQREKEAKNPAPVDPAAPLK